MAQTMPINGLVISDENVLISHSDAEINIWDNSWVKWNVSPEQTIYIDGTTKIRLSSDSNMMISANNPQVKRNSRMFIINIFIKFNEKYKIVKTISAHNDRITDLILSRDNRRIFSSSKDKTVKEWLVEDQSILDEWNHIDGALCLS
jgi:WD40 repeat protein